MTTKPGTGSGASADKGSEIAKKGNPGPEESALFFPEKKNEIVLHAFKLEEAVVVKNVGIQTFVPDPTTHTHFYRPMDEQGRSNQFCEPRLGHWHEVKTVWDPEMANPNEEGKKGWWKTECGPALCRVELREFNSGTNRMEKIEKVVQLDESDPRKAAKDKTKTHSHLVSYHHSNKVELKRPKAGKVQ